LLRYKHNWLCPICGFCDWMWTLIDEQVWPNCGSIISGWCKKVINIHWR
jgi:hypothetical protein